MTTRVKVIRDCRDCEHFAYSSYHTASSTEPYHMEYTRHLCRAKSVVQPGNVTGLRETPNPPEIPDWCPLPEYKEGE